jgi:thiol:disulfide interchange protein DsbD
MCDDKVCYPPKNVPFTIETAVSTAPPEYAHTDLFAPLRVEEGHGAWYWFPVAFAVGIIFNLMPCVLPVLPIKAIGFYEAAQHSRARSIGLATAFSIGIIAIFAILAVLILVTKQLTWGQQFSNPWFIWPLVIILLAMGLGLMGLFSLRLPTAVYTVTPRHDTVAGNVAFGGLTGLLSTPCTAPLFPPLLFWANTQPTSIGVLAMLTVGLGMASPYLLLSAFPQLARRVPRAGPWADLFKQMMGWLVIGAAVYFAAGRLIPGAAFWWAVVAVAAIAAIYLLARTIGHGAGRRGIAIASVLALLIFGSTFAIAARMNGTFISAAHKVDWVPYSDSALATARAAGQTVLVKFTANWCGNCQYIEATVYRDATTVAALKAGHILALKADLTLDSAPGTDLLKTLNSSGGIPLTAIYLPGKNEPVQLTSIYTTEQLLAVLNGPGNRIP